MKQIEQKASLVLFIGIFASALALAASALSAQQVTAIKVVEAQFQITLSDGKILKSRDLVGTVLRLSTGIEIRIDAIETDPADSTNEILLHTMSVRRINGTWENICSAGPKGRQQGFPLSGRTLSNGHIVEDIGAFEIVCTSGARGKCVRAGYKPWKTAPDGKSMRAYHKACVRMMRADYCGDGIATTRDGILITFADRADLQRLQQKPGMTFEAAWSKNGAVCIARTRVPENLSLKALLRRCPRLRDVPTGAYCTPDVAKSIPTALLFNRSFPKAKTTKSNP